MLITSSANQKYKDLLKLHESKNRKKTGLFLVEGEHLIQEAIKYQRLQTLIVKEGTHHLFSSEEIIELSPNLFDKLSQTVSSSSLMAVCTIQNHEFSKASRVLVCERIQDPGNMGTLIRTACAFGFDQIVCTEDCVDIYNEKVIRSTQGALFQIPITYKAMNDIVSHYKRLNFKLYATGFKNSVSLSNLNEKYPLCLFLGNEGQGLSDFVLNAADDVVSIEMHDFDSLNVAVAGAILMYRFRKP